MSDSNYTPRSSFESLRAASPAPSHFEPDTLPPANHDRHVWESSEFDMEDAIIDLTPAEVGAVRAAVVSFKLANPRKDPKDPGAEFTNINTTTFVLPESLKDKLAAASDKIHHGQGFASIRGLDAAKFNDEEAIIAFTGINAHVANKRATDDFANQTLSHIRDATHEQVPEFAKDIGLAGSKITSAMDYHSDRYSGDILAMHLRNLGEKGGEQYIASWPRIYNELLETEPEVLETMAAPNWPFELKMKDGSTIQDNGPVLFFSPTTPKTILQLVKAPLEGTPRIPRSPTMTPLTPSQKHAMARVQDLASRFGTKLDRRPGDIQYMHNLSILHARDAYAGAAPGVKSTRHAIRMFLRDEGRAWKKPEPYKARFDNPFQPRKEEFTIVDLDPWRKISGRESHG